MHWNRGDVFLLLTAALLTLTATLAAEATAGSELFGDIHIQGEFESLSQTRQRQQQQHLCQRELP